MVRVEGRDLRMPALGAAAWLGALAGLFAGAWLGWAVGLMGCVALVTRGWWWRHRWAFTAWLLLALAIGTSAGLRDVAVAGGAVARLAEQRAAVDAVVRVVDDPRLFAGSFGDRVLVRVQVLRVTTAEGSWQVRSPVLVAADATWESVALGTTLSVRLRLAPADDHDLAARASPLDVATVVDEASLLWQGSAAVRAGVKAAASGGAMPARALVPALVDGDDSALPDEVKADFRTTGLTHLLAVSGTNLTLVVGCLVIVGRWCGVRGRWHYLVAVLGIVGFILLARTEPSVVRAAAMGGAALLGLSRNGTDRGLRALGVAVVGLLAWDPWMATTVGFALSVLATAGILALTPGWVARLSTWLPRWAAQAIAVPLAAQIACTPVVTAISGEVSLVAVLANLLAAPLVAPATVCGLLGGLVHLVSPWLGALFGRMAVWSAAGIIEVAHRSAGTELPAISWSTGAGALAALTAICVVVVLVTGPLLSRRVPTVCAGCLLLVVLLVPLPTPGWPPAGWILVACDVGQGDGLVLRAGAGAAVVVDAGPDPGAMSRCLDRLGIVEVPLLVLSHFHADHVGGLPGVLEGRRVGEVLVAGLDDPPGSAAAVRRQLPAARVPAYGETVTVGALTLQVIGPPPSFAPTGANDASLVLLAEVAGTRVLLTGDVEPPAQAALRPTLAGLTVDVLKVPHHGSRHQEFALFAAIRPRVAIVSAGADNDYGHPAPETLEVLDEAGVEVLRTDRTGDVAVVRRGGELRTLR